MENKKKGDNKTVLLLRINGCYFKDNSVKRGKFILFGIIGWFSFFNHWYWVQNVGKNYHQYLRGSILRALYRGEQ